MARTRASPAPQPARQRVLRSQSREASLQPNTRRTRQTSRQFSEESEDQVLGPTRNVRQNNPPAPRLESLSEDSDEDENRDEPVNFVSSDLRISDDEQSVAGSASGRTQNDTFSQSEIGRHPPEQMLSNIGVLHAQAKALLGRFKLRTETLEESQALILDVQNEDSQRRHQINAHWDVLSSTQQLFGSMDFLRPDVILRGLLRLKDTQALPKSSRVWRPDDVICEVNLATFVHCILTHPFDDPNMPEWLLSFDMEFPSAFVVNFNTSGKIAGAGDSAIISRTFDFALELRTQLFISKLAENMIKEPDTIEDPDAAEELLLDFMLTYDKDAVRPDEALETNESAKGWESLPSPQVYENGRYANSIVQRTRDIRELLFRNLDLFVRQDGRFDLSSGLRRLQNDFPWTDFQGQLLQWANLRLTEIDYRMRSVGGIDEMTEALEHEVQRRLENPNAPGEGEDSEDDALPKVAEQPQLTIDQATQAPASTGNKVPARPGALFRYRSSAPRVASASEAAPEGPVRQTVERETTLTSQAPMQSPGKRARNERLGDLYVQHRMQQRSLMDSQPDGVRLNWDEEGSPQPQPPTQPNASRPQFRLPRAQQAQQAQQASHRTPVVQDEDYIRGPEDDVQDPSEDEGFQEDTRTVPVARRRQTSTAAPVRDPTPENGSAPQDSTPLRRRRSSEEATGTARKRQRRNPGQDIDPVPPTTEDDLADLATQANFSAKHAIRRAKPKPQRQRMPWTHQEVQALLEAIGEHGGEGNIPYAYIKKMDEKKVFANRNDEDLRFKARLLKVDFLLARETLPENLEYVMLGKKEIDRLGRYGVEYEQEAVRGRARDLSP